MTNGQLLQQLQSLSPQQLEQEADARNEFGQYGIKGVYIVQENDPHFEDEQPPAGTVIIHFNEQP